VGVWKLGKRIGIKWGISLGVGIEVVRGLEGGKIGVGGDEVEIIFIGGIGRMVGNYS
jgi:hypothetical protein